MNDHMHRFGPFVWWPPTVDSGFRPTRLVQRAWIGRKRTKLANGIAVRWPGGGYLLVGVASRGALA